MKSVKWSLAIVGMDRGYVKSKGAISRGCLWHAGIGLLLHVSVCSLEKLYCC